MAIFGCTVDGKRVQVKVVDLTEFVHAGPEDQVYYHDDCGSLLITRKVNLRDISIIDPGWSGS